MRRDPHLPGLRLLLDPDAFTEAVQSLLAGGILGPGWIDYVRYKPHSKCLVTYTIPTLRGPVRLYARALRPRPARPGRIMLGETVEVFLFPQDRILRSLRDVARGDIDRLISALMPEWRFTGPLRVRHLRYKPERRFVGKVKGATGEAAVIRLYDQAGYLRARRAIAAIGDDETLRFPPLRGDSAQRRALALGWMKGTQLQDELAHPAAVATAGRALAEFHAQQGDALVSLPRRAVGATLVAVANGLAAISPAVGPGAARLAERLQVALADVASEERPIHGDFNSTQVLFTGSRAAFLDLDEARWGDPAADAGLFIAHLERDVLRGVLSAEQAATAAAALLEGYRSRRPLSPERVRLHLAAGLMRIAPLPFRQHDPDWPSGISALLARAGAVAAASQPLAGAAAAV